MSKNRKSLMPMVCLVLAGASLTLNHLTHSIPGILWSLLLLASGFIGGLVLLILSFIRKTDRLHRIMNGMVVIACILVIPFFSVRGLRKKARRMNCSGNLKSMGCALLMYSGDYSGIFPPEFELLNSTGYLVNSKVYWCPSAREAPDTVGPDTGSYQYFGNGLRDDNTYGSTTVLACDKPENHSGEWMNCLFIDGHVEGIEARDLQDIIRQRDWIIPGINSKEP